MLNICISFDYELFFGENNGTNEEILFEPTRKLIKMLAKEKVSATFFVDTCSVQQHKRINKIDYVTSFSEQIQDMSRCGQDVQLHIHSHWLNSKYNGSQWIFDDKSYRLQSYGLDEGENDSVASIIREGISYLNTTIGKIDTKYHCIAYRAGGFTIQPHKELVAVLYDNGIRVDSSVAPMLYSTGINSYDFRKKSEHVNWYISSESEWYVDNMGGKSLLEIPIATENKNPMLFLLKRILTPNKIKLKLGPKRGSYIGTGSVGQTEKKLKSIYRYVRGYNALSLDAYQAEFLYLQIKRFMRKHNCKNKDCSIALIGHPKLIDEEYINNLQRLIRKLKEDNGCICIKSVAQIYADTRKG